MLAYDCACCGHEVEQIPADNVCPGCHNAFDGSNLGKKCPHCGFFECDPEGCDFCLPNSVSP